MKNNYDETGFFDEYIQKRDDEGSFNKILEQPLMQKRIVDLKGKRVLDLGCGYGINSFKFIEQGAAYCLAIDISEKMLNLANSKNTYKNLEFKNLSIDNLSDINDNFDFIYSSLTFHYIEDWNKMFKNISRLLKKDGRLLFSTNNPFRVCNAAPNGWVRDADKKVIGFNISDYGMEGKRMSKWWKKYDVEMYHHTFSTLLNCLGENGLFIEDCEESMGDQEAINLNPKIGLMKISPEFIIIKAKKL